MTEITDADRETLWYYAQYWLNDAGSGVACRAIAATREAFAATIAAQAKRIDDLEALLIAKRTFSEADVEAAARIIEAQAWAALGTGDTLAYKNRRTSSFRKARSVLSAVGELGRDGA